MKQMLVVAVLFAGGCATRIPDDATATHGAAACTKTCTEKDLSLAGSIVMDDGDVEKCLCEVKGDESASAEALAGNVIAIAAPAVERR